ncbi:uncharacterized protein LOC117240565 [Bombus vosnesenskii]|uniref:Uncharacterized protein LOC117239976 n=1 Tax=Bombus vosnesenskii TaxID=207650 RepID=A0A6J3L8X7_9HYME|nr:uncharacterized protein LOC117239976 [Bombus vosnesenskii]XP_033362462.1 uncharacterized protein LOC117240565 [Bombus vosnesenskii]
MEASTIASALLSTVQSKITTDQGRQFESQLYKELCWFSVSKVESGDKVPRHEQLRRNFRTAIKEDLNAAAAEMICGTGIRLPAEFFIATEQQANAEYANWLKEQMRKVRPYPATRHGGRKISVFKKLESSPYVFLRHSAIGGPLQPQFDGPFKVVKRGEKDYVIKINDRDVTVSIDRLKLAFVVPDDLEERTA